MRIHNNKNDGTIIMFKICFFVRVYLVSLKLLIIVYILCNNTQEV